MVAALETVAQVEAAELAETAPRQGGTMVGAAASVEVVVKKLVCSVELDGNWKLTEASDNYVQTLGFTL